MDWTTVVASIGAGAAGGAVAAWATLAASRRERQASVDRMAGEHARERLNVLEAVAAELRFNRELSHRVRTEDAFVPYEMDVLRSATHEIATMPKDPRIDVQEAQTKMLAYNARAESWNTRRSIPETASAHLFASGAEIEVLALAARPTIDKAKDAVERYVKQARQPQHDPST